MAINSVATIKPLNKEYELKKTNNKTNNNQTNPVKLPTPNSELLRVMSGVKLKRPEPTAYTQESASAMLEKHQANKFLDRREDRKNLINALCRKDIESSNLKMQLDMIAQGNLEPSTVSCYWATGKMSEGLAEDLDMMYEAQKNNKVIADIYVPKAKTQAEGQKNAKIGDVFEVEGQKKVYVKADENESRQLNMDKDMFIKLFPPAKRFTTQQQGIGDCYLVSTLNTLMENPKARVAAYEAINQEGKDVTVKFKNGYGEYKYSDAKLPLTIIKKYHLKGAMGIQILEDAYGKDSVNKADFAFKKIMNEKIEAKKAELEKAPADKKADIKKSLDGHQKRLNDYLEAKADKSRDIVIHRGDNNFNIYYEEDENGLKFSDLMRDPDNKNDKFFDAADFYRGALGGYNFEVLERFGFGGFRQMNLDMPADNKKATELMKQKDFNKNYIMTGGTRLSGPGRTENPVATDAGIYGFHAYTLKPQVDAKGELKIRCTNPWNTSYNADVSYKDFMKFYDSVSIVDVNSYGKNQKLEKQPVKYDTKGPVINREAEGGDHWYITGNKKPVIKVK